MLAGLYHSYIYLVLSYSTGSQTNVGLAAGLSIGFFLVFIGLSVFVIALVYRVAYHKRQQTVETHVISSTPSTGVTAVDKSLSTPYHDAAAYINPPAVQVYYSIGLYRRIKYLPSHSICFFILL